MTKKRKPARKRNMWPFAAKGVKDTTPARGGIAAHTKSGKKPTSAGAQYKGYSIRLLEDGSYVIPKIDPDTQFEDLKQAKRFVDSETKARRNNPSWRAYVGGRFVGTAYGATKKEALARFADPSDRYASSIVLKSSSREVPEPGETPAQTRRRYASNPGKNRKSKRNPSAQSAEAYQDFHGRPSEETVTVETKVHYHKHLSACGELRKLVIQVPGKLFKVNLAGFKKALLCENEQHNQLFIEGGDQAVDVKRFGIKTPHEVETLGDVRNIEYFTTKDHLGSDGGEALYVHAFKKPYPVLIYHALDKQLTFAGGKYKVLPEGIEG